MADADATSRRSRRSYARLTDEHLRRLAAVAEKDHAFFTRPDGRPEYKSRRLAAALAQGAALHYLDGRTGVKDLDVWTFYAAIPGERFPGDKRVRRDDFGPSSLGRQTYNMYAARSERQQVSWQRWSAYTGRRVDFCVRALPVQADAPINSVISALQEWLARGAQSTADPKPSSWHLAKKAVVLLYPDSHHGDVIWALGSALGGAGQTLPITALAEGCTDTRTSKASIESYVLATLCLNGHALPIRITEMHQTA